LAAQSKAEEIERERGKPLKDVLVEEFPQHGTLAGLARALGVTPGTMQGWLLRCGLMIETRLVEHRR
jgi:hypothetical protein